MTIVVVQCRLFSSRLQAKALLPIGRRSEVLVVWTLRAMKKVQADEHWLACDTASYADLHPLAEQNGWNCFAGPEENVLERFCLLAEKSGADVIVRATADNPFLFYEAAQASLGEFMQADCDYFTYAGLPHGSGIEVFSAKALLKANKSTEDPFEREHVGPALYRHPDRFVCITKPAPAEWNYPFLRTTVDTASDYRNACRLCRVLENNDRFEGVHPPYPAQDIVSALQIKKAAVLLVPAVTRGRGTGHLRRCLSLASSQKIHADLLIRTRICVPVKRLLEQALKQKKITPDQIVYKMPEPGEYSLVVSDSFCLTREEVSSLRSVAPLVALDEGTSYTKGIDYLVDIIPPLTSKCNLNGYAPFLLSLPPLLPPLFDFKAEAAGEQDILSIQNILICVGGEDPAQLSFHAALAFSAAAQRIGAKVCAVLPGLNKEKLAGFESESLEFVSHISDLPSKIRSYELVVTHYGFTAFEAALSGCALILLETSCLHKRLAKKYGCVCLSKARLKPKKIAALISNPLSLVPTTLRSVLQMGDGRLQDIPYSSALLPDKDDSCIKNDDLPSFIAKLASGKTYFCPLCGKNTGKSFAVDPVIARDSVKTLRACKTCGMLYIGALFGMQKKYGQSYFFEQYKIQYGKTYLEDFETIKKQGLRRMALIVEFAAKNKVQKKDHRLPSILDVGCAYGAFLSAASEFGWRPFGTDICKQAVDYVRNELSIPALCAEFSDFNPDFGQHFRDDFFDALSMWYVIEHFSDLHSILSKVSSLVKKGGIFAFSTPSASGISARFSKKEFFRNSPSDHFSIWKPKNSSSVLKKYGFKVCKIVSTGHHPERFPYLKIKQNNSFGAALSRIFSLGDTFEVYCKKIS